MNLINSAVFNKQPCGEQNVRFKMASVDADEDDPQAPGLIAVIASKDIAVGEELLSLYGEDEDGRKDIPLP
jgi:hypothetical protein